MNKSILAYATILVLSLGASWMQYTSDVAPVAKTGVVLADIKKEALQTITYTSPDLKVVFEVRKDAVGSYGWVTVTETKKKKGPDGKETSDITTTSFKAGSAGDKLIDTWSPLMVLRELGKPDDSKIKDFGLDAPKSTLVVTAGGKTWTFEIGGETYGTKDLYVRDTATGLVYVLDDEVAKSFKYAKTKLKDTLVVSPKVDEIESFQVSRGAADPVTWTQKNIVDRAAAFWTRDGSNKDENFSLWIDKFLKIRTMDYVEGPDPEGLLPVMDVTVKPVGKPAETITLYKLGDEWYGKGTYVRSLVKLNKTSTADAEDEIDDVMEGKAPPAPAKPATPEMPPGMGPGGPGGPTGMSAPDGMPGNPSMPGMPMPGAHPPLPMPTHAPPGSEPVKPAPPTGGASVKPGSGPPQPTPPTGSKPTGK